MVPLYCIQHPPNVACLPRPVSRQWAESGTRSAMRRAAPRPAAPRLPGGNLVTTTSNCSCEACNVQYSAIVSALDAPPLRRAHGAVAGPTHGGGVVDRPCEWRATEGRRHARARGKEGRLRSPRARARKRGSTPLSARAGCSQRRGCGGVCVCVCVCVRARAPTWSGASDTTRPRGGRAAVKSGARVRAGGGEWAGARCARGGCDRAACARSGAGHTCGAGGGGLGCAGAGRGARGLAAANGGAARARGVPAGRRVSRARAALTSGGPAARNGTPRRARDWMPPHRPRSPPDTSRADRAAGRVSCWRPRAVRGLAQAPPQRGRGRLRARRRAEKQHLACGAGRRGRAR